MYSESNEQEPRKEVPVAPEGSQDTNQDQNADHNDHPSIPNGKETTNTRQKYDGTKPHGVVPAKLETVEAAAKAKSRLKLRLTFLNKEYAKCVAIIQDPDKSISDKAPAVKTSEKINEDLKKLQIVANELRDRIPELEELVKDSVENFDPTTKVEVTI